MIVLRCFVARGVHGRSSYCTLLESFLNMNTCVFFAPVLSRALLVSFSLSPSLPLSLSLFFVQPTAREGMMSSGGDPVARVLLDQSDDEHYPWTLAFRRPNNDQLDHHETDQREPERKQSEPQHLQQQPQPQEPPLSTRADSNDDISSSSSSSSAFQQQQLSSLPTPRPVKSLAHAGTRKFVVDVPALSPGSHATFAFGNLDDNAHDRGNFHGSRRFAPQHVRAKSAPEPAAAAGPEGKGCYERGVVANHGRTISNDEGCGKRSRRFKPIAFPS